MLSMSAGLDLISTLVVCKSIFVYSNAPVRKILNFRRSSVLINKFETSSVKMMHMQNDPNAPITSAERAQRSVFGKFIA